MKATFALFVFAILVALSQAAPNTVDDCFDIKDTTQCKSSQMVVDGVVDACVWCNCSAVPSSCVNESKAKTLPQTVFNCEFNEPSKVIVDDCYDIKNSDDCFKSADGISDCSWCIAKAVPSICTNTEEASKVPDSVFHCIQPNATRQFF